MFCRFFRTLKFSIFNTRKILSTQTSKIVDSTPQGVTITILFNDPITSYNFNNYIYNLIILVISIKILPQFHVKMAHLMKLNI